MLQFLNTKITVKFSMQAPGHPESYLQTILW